jgi:uncharacterized protein (TIGR02453 family)
MVPSEAFRLLAELEANNNRDWFQAHREAIREQVQEPFARTLEAISAALADAPVPLRGGDETMFRMHRDVRFSADKSPYKTNVSGLLTPSGSKTETGGLTYLHMDSQGGFLACGFYKMPTPALNRIRDRIVAKPDTFRAVLDDLEAAGLELSADDMLKAMPRGYSDHSDAWFANYLKQKVFIVRREIAQADWVSGSVVAEAVRVATACASLLRFGQVE